MDTPIIALLQSLDVVVEGSSSSPLSAIGNGEWTKRVEGKQWRGVKGFGEPTTAAALEDGLLLYSLVLALKPKVCVEIGTHQGLSTCFIAAALKENEQGRLYTFDINCVASDRAKLNVAHYGLAEQVEFYTVPDLLITVAPSLAPIDFYFDDGSHTAKEVMCIAELVQPHLADDAHLMVHDSMLLDSVQQGIQKVLEILGTTEVINIGTCRGMTVIRRT